MENRGRHFESSRVINYRCTSEDLLHNFSTYCIKNLVVQSFIGVHFIRHIVNPHSFTLTWRLKLVQSVTLVDLNLSPEIIKCTPHIAHMLYNILSAFNALINVLNTFLVTYQICNLLVVMWNQMAEVKN